MSKVISLLFLLISLAAFADERIELQGTSIIGNRELPKILYIVPWKSSELPQLTEPPLASMIDEALSPLDREEFRREIHYFNALSTTASIENEN